MRSIPAGNDDHAVRERMALRAEWNNVAGRIARLDSAAQSGLLNTEHIEELAIVSRELTALLPMMKSRRYHLPDLDALARAAARPAAQPT